ncbi:MAG: FtsX-like permease family protein [Xanthomonadales bacterium]|nr:ABC transporter permease [Gammaproteobacteria bacterium]NNK03326.1 FtsX-like permease family protein [Xanthomonadales bacterium]NNK99416.1 FtsX-like permease family protein [Xanthomonadales bacterium]
MFSYYLKLGWLSIRRNPLLSALMVAAIAVGIGACMTIITVNYVMSSNPIPHKSEQLFYVQLDSWDPNNQGDDGFEPPDQMTYIDAMALMKAGKAYRQVASNRSSLVLEPQNEDERPFSVDARNTWSDFFPMFDLPFIYGSGWDDTADRSLERVVVLSKEINERVFGGENPVGRNVRLNGMDFQVVGVIDDFLPVPKFYDVTNGAFNEPEEIYIPFNVAVEYDLPRNGNTNCWKPFDEGIEAFLNSECAWIQFWAELRNETEKREYMAFLNAYAEQQKQLGRFPRPLNNQLSDVMEWMEKEEVVEDDAQVMLGLSLLFLVVCLLNTIGLLLAKFMGKSGDISLRRALGATRANLFTQHMIESGMIGLGGGVLGLGLTWLGLRGIEMLFGDFVENLVGLDWVMVLTAIGLAILSALLAGLYPTWRACRVVPASQLKIH